MKIECKYQFKIRIKAIQYKKYNIYYLSSNIKFQISNIYFFAQILYFIVISTWSNSQNITALLIILFDYILRVIDIPTLLIIITLISQIIKFITFTPNSNWSGAMNKPLFICG